MNIITRFPAGQKKISELISWTQMEVVTEILFTLPVNCAIPNLTARTPSIEEN